MSKQINHDEVTKIFEIIIKIKEFNCNFSDIINKNINNSNNEIIIANEVSKKLAKNGYKIISIDPLKIEH